jgi:hypothetical protein
LVFDFWLRISPLVVVVGHGDYRTKADQCLKAIALLRVIPITTTTTSQQQQQQSQVRIKNHAPGSFGLMEFDEWRNEKERNFVLF